VIRAKGEQTLCDSVNHRFFRKRVRCAIRQNLLGSKFIPGHVGRWLGFVAWMVYTKASGLATDSRITKMDCAKMALVV